MGFNRLAGLSALGFATLILGINFILQAGDPPAGDAAPAVVAAYFADQATVVQAGVLVGALNWILISLFGAGAFVRIGRVERDRGEAWAVVGVIGIAMMTVMFSAVTAVRLALTTGDPATGTLWHLHNGFFTVNSMSLVVVLTGFSIGGLRTATLRPWHGSLGLVSAGLLAIGTVISFFNPSGGGAAATVGLIGFLGWAAWLATFGVVLLRTKTTVPVRV